MVEPVAIAGNPGPPEFAGRGAQALRRTRFGAALQVPSECQVL